MELTFTPNVEVIPAVRRSVVDLFSQVIADRDAVSRLALAAHEMLENAIRYTDATETRVRITVEPGPEMRMTIRTWNETSADHRVIVEGMFAAMRDEPDPFTYYCSLMRSRAKMDGSGLGLARIRAEAEMELSYQFDESVLCIEARGEARAA